MSREFFDTGIPWIGTIPKNWSIQQVKSAFEFKKSKAKQEKPVILSLARDAVKIRDISNNEGQLAESYIDYNPVDFGDFLLNPMDLYSGANCNVARVKGVISPAYINLRARNGINPFYYDFYFKIQYWHMAMFAHGKGVSFDHRWTINKADVLKYWIPKLSFNEQNKIVELINKKLEQIDKLLSLQEQQIEKLKDYKQSIISNLVTKGLSGHASFKESGIEWIGMIPTHWEIRRLKNCISRKLEYGANASGSAFDESLPRYIRITDISLDNELKDTDKLSLSENDSSSYILHDGDVLFARSGATVGKSFLYKKEYGRSAFAGYLIRATVDRNVLSSEYLYYFTLSNEYWEWAKGIFIQATIQNIGANRYANMPLTVPPLDEQDKIIEKIKKFESNIKLTLRLIEKKIEKLNEYKKSLIYEYVTGKLEAI